MADEPIESDMLKWRVLAESHIRLMNRATAIERLLVEKKLLTGEEILDREKQVQKEAMQDAQKTLEAEAQEALLRLLSKSEGPVQ